jgi:hypothetical protein
MCRQQWSEAASVNTEIFDRRNKDRYLKYWRNDDINETGGSNTFHNRYNAAAVDNIGDKKFL